MAKPIIKTEQSPLWPLSISLFCSGGWWEGDVVGGMSEVGWNPSSAAVGCACLGLNLLICKMRVIITPISVK